MTTTLRRRFARCTAIATLVIGVASLGVPGARADQPGASVRISDTPRRTIRDATPDPRNNFSESTDIGEFPESIEDAATSRPAPDAPMPVVDSSTALGPTTTMPVLPDRPLMATSRMARPPRDDRYVGYYVGGSRALRGESRDTITEGTWGWDYSGILFPKRVALSWSHRTGKQGPHGTYATERQHRSHH